MKIIDKLLFLTLASCFSAPLISQAYAPAIALPIDGITIDGDLNDWPENLQAYPIANLAFGNVSGREDLNANFMVGYNQVEGNLYVGLTVNDSENIFFSPNKSIDEIDNVMLYFDGLHDPVGGERQLLIAGSDLREVGGSFPNASPYHNGFSTWDGVQLKIQSEAEKTVYEWQIPVKQGLKPGTVIGFDLIIADVDLTEEDVSWMTWKRGTGKSEGSQRLGEILLISKWDETGKISGKVAIDSNHIPSASFVKIQSRSNPSLWLRLPVDSLGSYHGYLPKGAYQIVPATGITSPLYSTGFSDKPLRIAPKHTVFTEIAANKLSIPNTLELEIIPAPSGLFEENGILLQPTIEEYKIDKFVNTYQQYLNIPGVSLAIVKDGVVVYDKVFGVKNVLTQEPLDENSLFEAASISKAIFAMMVLKLVDKGQLDLDKPLYQYLRFPNLEHDERYKLLTARQVLNHQSGISNWPLGSFTGSLPDSKAEFLFTPGTEFEYSGEAVNYLGRVVVNITGMSLSELFNKSLAPTFGLQTTRFSYTDDLADKIALGHWHGYPRYKNKFPGIDSPASSVMSNAHDFANVLTGLLLKKHLSAGAYRLITTPHQEIKEKKKIFDKELPQALAHGFFITGRKIGRSLAHGGNNGDYDCKFTLIPEQNMGFVVFTNSNLGDEFIRLLELYLLEGKEAYQKEFVHHHR